MKAPRRILVLEDQPLLRDLVSETLTARGFNVATAATVTDAKHLVDTHYPVAAVIDIGLSAGPNGLELADYLGHYRPNCAIVFLTDIPDPRFVGRDRRAVPEGAAYLRKGQLANVDELVEALETVLQARTSVRFRHDLDSTRPLAKLSRNQLAVLALMARGLSNNQISERRGTSVRAVEGMVTRVFEALKINPTDAGNSRVEATRAYLEATGGTAGASRQAF